MNTIENLKSGQMLSYFQLIENIGCGKSGQVWSALDTRDNSVVAIKIYTSQASMADKARYEFEIASRMAHSRILSPTEFLICQEIPIMVMPYCTQRSADGVAGYIDECLLWRILRDMALALTYVHEKGYAHLDIKPSNILLAEDKALLSDFGSCRPCDDVSQNLFVANDGSSFRFDAPEYRNGCYDKKSDIWSLGATIFYLYMGCHIFNGMGGRAQHMTTKIPMMRNELPELSDLIKNCLCYVPANRPEAKDIAAVAEKQYASCKQQVQQPPRKKVIIPESPEFSIMEDIDKYWPEEMHISL